MHATVIRDTLRSGGGRFTAAAAATRHGSSGAVAPWTVVAINAFLTVDACGELLHTMTRGK